MNQPKDYLKKEPTKAERMIDMFGRQVQQDIQNLSMQLVALARAAKLTPEDFVKMIQENGANFAFLQNCQLIEKRLELEAKEKAELKLEASEETKQTIEQLAIKEN